MAFLLQFAVISYIDMYIAGLCIVAMDGYKTYNMPWGHTIAKFSLRRYK